MTGVPTGTGADGAHRCCQFVMRYSVVRVIATHTALPSAQAQVLQVAGSALRAAG